MILQKNALRISSWICEGHFFCTAAILLSHSMQDPVRKDLATLNNYV